MNSPTARKFEFNAVFDENKLQVGLCQAPGGGGSYSLTLQNIIWAAIIFQAGAWRVFVKKGCALQTADFLACVELIDPTFDITEVIIRPA